MKLTLSLLFLFLFVFVRSTPIEDDNKYLNDDDDDSQVSNDLLRKRRLATGDYRPNRVCDSYVKGVAGFDWQTATAKLIRKHPQLYRVRSAVNDFLELAFRIYGTKVSRSTVFVIEGRSYEVFYYGHYGYTWNWICTWVEEN